MVIACTSKVVRRRRRGYLCATAVGGRTGILPISVQGTKKEGFKWLQETNVAIDVCIRSVQLLEAALQHYEMCLARTLRQEPNHEQFQSLIATF